MAVQDTSTRIESGLELARAQPVSSARPTKSVRRLPVQKDWPLWAIIATQFGILFGGTLLVEVIYSYPGLGNLMVDAVRNADLPIIQAVGLTYCIVVLMINTVVDALYMVLNPKLRIA